MTIGPCQAIGSPRGRPETSRNRTGCPRRLHDDLVPVLEQDQVPVFHPGIPRCLAALFVPLPADRRPGPLAAPCPAPDEIGEDGVAGRRRVDEPAIRLHPHVEVLRIDDDVPHRPPRRRHLAADDPDPCASAGVIDLGDLGRSSPPGSAAASSSGRRAGWPRAGIRPCGRSGSPLGISWWMMPLPAVIHCTSPGADDAPVAQAVAVLHRALQHIGDGLDAAVRVPGEAGEVLRRVVRRGNRPAAGTGRTAAPRRSRRPASGARRRPRWSAGFAESSGSRGFSPWEASFSQLPAAPRAAAGAGSCAPVSTFPQCQSLTAE